MSEELSPMSLHPKWFRIVSIKTGVHKSFHVPLCRVLVPLEEVAYTLVMDSKLSFLQMSFITGRPWTVVPVQPLGSTAHLRRTVLAHRKSMRSDTGIPEPVRCGMNTRQSRRNASHIADPAQANTFPPN